MPALRRFAVLALSVLLFACGASPPAPRASSEITVGKGGAAPATTAPVAPTPISEEDALIPIGPNDPVLGRRDAFVTIVIFSDFQCPFCGRLATRTMSRVRETYGDDVRLVFKNQPLPFHKHARFAAEVGAGVFALGGAGAFWAYHDQAFRDQRRISPDAVRDWARAAGVEGAALEQGLASKRWDAKIEADVALATKVGANGTPTSFINGELVTGAQPFDKFQEVIDRQLAAAKALAARGVPRDQLYRQLVAANFAEAAVKEAKADRAAAAPEPKPDTTVWRVPVGKSPARGSKNALVTIVEFGDYQCPYCKRVEQTVERLRKEYGARLRVVWKDMPLPFHKRAMPAATLALAARAQKGDAAFWQVHDALFASQPKLDDADLEVVARAAGVDFKKAMAARHAHERVIHRDLALADSVKASGTPHFFINGRRLVGAQAYDKFKQLIDEEMTKAEALVKKGVAKSAVYETVIKGGQVAGEPERKSVAPAASAPYVGAKHAKVVIQEFADFQCPFCKRVEPTVDALLKAYPGKVKVVWRNLPLPFHVHAELAAEAAREVFVQKGNAGFAKMRKLLFEHQHDLERTDLEGYAQSLGLNMTKFRVALDRHTHRKAVQADIDAAKAAGIKGTPGFVIGPFFLSGAQPLRKFELVVDRALKEPANKRAAAKPKPKARAK